MSKRVGRIVVVLLLGAAWGTAFAAEPQGGQGIDLFALPEFREATQGWSPEARFMLAALLHISLQQYERAIPLLQVLVTAQPEESGLWILLAMAHNRVGESREALDAANVAIILDPQHEAYYLERGIARFSLGRDRGAAGDLSRHLESYATSALGYLYLGLAQARLGDLPAARASLTEAGSLSPPLTLMTNYYIGLIDAQGGDITKGRMALEETLKALKDVDTPWKEEVRRRLEQVRARENADLAARLRAALVQADARNSLKHMPKPIASRGAERRPEPAQGLDLSGIR